MEIAKCLHIWIGAGALGLFLALLVAIAAGYGFKRFRSIGWGMIVLGCCFLHSMASKPTGAITIARRSVTATNLVFDVAVTNALVGEFGQFCYKTATGNADVDAVEKRAGSPFLVPATNFAHTVTGNFIHSGIDRNFYLRIEQTNSNSQVVN